MIKNKKIKNYFFICVQCTKGWDPPTTINSKANYARAYADL